MTEEEKKLFKIFCINDNFEELKEETYFIFILESNDKLLVRYFGDGETELNPFTNEDDYYYGFNFKIIRVIENKTNKYFENGFIEISKYIYPKEIIEL